MKFINEAVNVTYENTHLMEPYAKDPDLNKISIKDLSSKVTRILKILFVYLLVTTYNHVIGATR